MPRATNKLRDTNHLKGVPVYMDGYPLGYFMEISFFFKIRIQLQNHSKVNFFRNFSLKKILIGLKLPEIGVNEKIFLIRNFNKFLHIIHHYV